MRKRIYTIIEVAAPNDRLSAFYDLFMFICILVSLLPLCTKSTEEWTFVLDFFTVTVFIIDYILRELTADFKYPDRGISSFLIYPFTPMAVIDLLSILPSFGLIASSMRLLRLFRLFRLSKVFRAFKVFKAIKALKIVRYSKSISIIAEVISAQKEALITVCGLAVGYVLISALIIFNVEPDTFRNFFEAVYWACVSLTTVGYGDIYPVSTAGRIVAMLSSVVGIAIVALPSGIITAGYMSTLQSNEHASTSPVDDVDDTNESL